MKSLICEMCCSNDIVKQDGMYVCQTCGTKYSVEEAKRMIIDGSVDVSGSTVKVDNSAFVEKYLANARRAKQKEDWPETEKYYNMVEQNDPTNIEAIFYSAFARVKSALLEAETAEKRRGVFNILIKSVSVIDDNYDNTNDKHYELLFEIMDDINGLKKGTIVRTTHLQEYVTKNGYGNIVDRNQIVEDDPLDVTFNMINDVVDAYLESLANIIIVQCKDLTKEEILEKAFVTLQNGYSRFALSYFCEYTKKNTNSPVGYAGEALAILACDEDLSEENSLSKLGKQTRYRYFVSLSKSELVVNALEKLRKATQYKTSDDKEKDALKNIINCKYGEYDLTLLMLTSAYSDYEAAKYLVEVGADIDSKSAYNVTALWYVCCKNPGVDNVGAARKIAELLLDNGAKVDVKSTGGIDLLNRDTDNIIVQMIRAKFPNAELGEAPATSGCYVATAVYGSYDCPQVWTLRRFRDYTLAKTWHGRAFIRTYYAISPTIVKWFGHTEWFKKMWKGKLDHMVANLNADGVEDTPYEDKEW